jgi:adenosylcobinamide-GDP ribazoletransferase
MSILPYGRNEEGIAHSLVQGKRRTHWIPGAVIVAVGSTFAGDWAAFLILNTTFLLTLVLLLYYYHRRLGCITGDMIGALGEITETALLVVFLSR